jgi:hypothetical protein
VALSIPALPEMLSLITSRLHAGIHTTDRSAYILNAYRVVVGKETG